LRYSIFIIFLSILVACNKDNKKDIIEKNKMAAILTDIHLAESYSTLIKDSLHQSGERNLDTLNELYQSILGHYKISLKEFNNSFEWYKKHPSDLDSVYQQVITNYTIMEDSLSKLH
jgi:hypothetical protein